MFDCIENIKIVSTHLNKSKPYGKNQSRLSHGFIFKIKGTVEYVFDGKTVTLHAGEVVFLPKGSSYEYTTDVPRENRSVVINFEAEMKETELKVYPLGDFYGANYILESFSELWNFGGASDRYKCMSVFYDFLSYISRIEHLNCEERSKHHVIDPAVEYLKSHIYDSTFKVDKLHHLCGISDTYFRKIFVSRFSMTPQEYVITMRISHAKSILDSGDYESIGEVARLVGYNDALYFSKAFKKIYGYPPSELNL